MLIWVLWCAIRKANSLICDPPDASIAAVQFLHVLIN